MTPIPLAQLGEPSIEFANYTGTRPSIQLRVSKTGSSFGGDYVVGEPWAYGQWIWWSKANFGIGGNVDYASVGTLTDYLAANPNAKVNQIGYSLGSGVLGDATITSMTFGCAKYTFDLAPAVQPETPTISGNAVFGSVLTANPGTDWTPTDATFTYQWYRDGVSVGTSGRSMTYTPVAADIGKKMTVAVTGAKTGYTAASATSAPTDTVVPALMAGQASITGTTVVGDTLTAVPGTWDPSNATFTYQWFRNGVAISGATAKTYVLASADMRTTITVAITGSRASYSPATYTSAPTAAVTVPAAIEICTDVDAGPLSTNVDNNGWDFSQSRATGHNDFVADGLHVWTEGDTSTDKAAGYRALSIPLADVPLADVGSVSMDLSNGVAGLPSIQLGVDRDGNGTWDGYLVNEGDLYGAGMWWTNKSGFGVPAGGGYDSLGTLDEYIAANPNAMVVSFGYSLGSGLKGSAVIHSITVGCVEYSFEGRIKGIMPTISGTPTVDQTLTADGLESGWEPTGLTFDYQWLRDGNPITGAIGATYTLRAADQGATISISVTGSKNGYTNVTETSLVTEAVAEATFVTVKPVIDGTAQVGQNLTATDPDWTPVASTKSYQWYVDGVAVSGATSKVYTVAPGDLGKKITFTVTGSRPGYTTAKATSLEAGPVTAGAMTVSAPTVTGIEKVGQTLTAAASVSTPPGATITYEWFRDGDSIGVGATHQITAADDGEELTVTATAVLAGYVTAKESTTTGTIGLGAMSVSAPTVTGIEKVGQTLTAADSVSTPGGAVVTYKWFRDGVVVGSGATYVVKAGDNGEKLTVTATAVLAGYVTAKESTTTGTIGLGAMSVSAPVVTGTEKVGQTLTAADSVSTPAGAVVTYKWFRDGVMVGTGATYVVKAGDNGEKLTVTATAVLAGYVDATKSTTTGTIAPGALQAPVPTVQPTQVKVGQSVTALPGAWGPAPVTLKYQWFADGVLISGADDSTYTAQGADYGKRLSVQVTGTKDGYGAVSKTSGGTDTVQRAGQTSGAVSITGKTTSGSKLTASVTGWKPADAQLSYQWYRNGALVTGATGSTYTLGAGDVGSKMTVNVTGKKVGYGDAYKLSAPTAVVTWAPTVKRIQGDDRYVTAINISKAGFTSAKTVFVATGQDYPDALSAAPVAAKQGAPLLLTLKNSLPASVANEIKRLKPTKIVIVGGSGAVSNAVMIQLKKIASTERVWGNDRYATSYNINTSKYGFQTATKAYVATGQMFPDALSASAAGAAVGAPVILVNGSATSLDAATKSQLSKLKVKNTIIAGGAAAVSTGVANGLKAATGVTPDRRGGLDRYETSRMIGADVFAPAKSVYLATGTEFPDALAGAVLSGQNQGPLYLVQPNCVPKPTLNQITAAAPSAITLFGGTGALSNNVADLKACK